jgi:hypothetical protein
MNNIIQPSNGLAQVQYRLALSDKSYFDFNPNKIELLKAILTDSVYGNNACSHLFQSQDTIFVRSLKQAMANANPLLMFRLGYGTGINTAWLPWQKHIICSHHINFTGIGSNSGHTIVINTNSALTAMKRASHVASHKGTISNIVKSLAVSNGLESLVEDTDGEFMLYQNFIDDTAFILGRLANRAINKKGVGGYYTYILDNTLHFHTVGYQSNVKTLDYYASPGSRIEAEDRSEELELWTDGIAGGRTVVTDPYMGGSKEVISSKSATIKLADNTYDYSSVSGGEKNILTHLGQNPVIESTARAQYAYQTARMQTFRIKLILQKTIMLRHGDILNLVIKQNDSLTDSYSGYYYVAETSHMIKGGQATSSYTLVRGETMNQSLLSVVQDSQNQAKSDSDSANGSYPNFSELQSTDVTINKTSETGYVTVSDAQTGNSL